MTGHPLLERIQAAVMTVKVSDYQDDHRWHLPGGTQLDKPILASAPEL